jgi:small GTP-binding protein
MKNNFKLAILGKESVGKSSIIYRYINNKFKEEELTTIGAAYNVFYPRKYNGKVKLEIWDTAGQERYKSLVPMYYRNSQIIIITFDITDIDTFNEAKYWVNHIKENTFNNPHIALFGNKKDLENKRQISIDEAVYYAKCNNIYYYEISALNGYGVNSSFNDIIEKSYLKYKSTINNNLTIKIIEKKRNCCFN